MLLNRKAGNIRQGESLKQHINVITIHIRMDMGLGGLRELVRDKEAWHAAVHGVTKSWTRLRDWTELNWMVEYMGIIFISLLSVFSHFQMINMHYLNNKITMKFAFLKGMDIAFIQI